MLWTEDSELASVTMEVALYTLLHASKLLRSACRLADGEPLLRLLEAQGQLRGLILRLYALASDLGIDDDRIEFEVERLL